MKLKYIKDENGKDLLTDEFNFHQVMMEWEKPYMEKSIDILDPSGSILEIGFGMGYSATKICENLNVKEYTVIECSPVVWNKFYKWRDKQRDSIKINLIKGRWQDVLETLPVFDSVYFDDYNGDDNQHPQIRFNKFIYQLLLNHVKIGTKISFYSTTKYNLLKNVNCIEFTENEYEIDIPKHCKYANGNKMYIPVYKVIAECDCDLKEKIFNTLANKDITNKIEKAKEYYSKSKPIYCNLLIIDNFYNNPIDTRNYILTQDFSVKGNYPGQRTKSYANNELRNIIEGYIKHFAGKITDWPDSDNTYNGAFQYTTSRDRTWVHTDGYNNWAGVLYLTPNAPVSSGTGIFRLRDGTRFEEETKIRNNEKLVSK